MTCAALERGVSLDVRHLHSVKNIGAGMTMVFFYGLLVVSVMKVYSNGITPISISAVEFVSAVAKINVPYSWPELSLVVC